MFTSTFRPTVRAVLYRNTSYSADGRVSLDKGVEIGIAPVRLAASVGPTSIRTDKSGSQARADELTYDARILMDPTDNVRHGNIIEILGLFYKVEEIYPRHEMTGDLNHLQVDLVRWAGSQ